MILLLLMTSCGKTGNDVVVVSDEDGNSETIAQSDYNEIASAFADEDVTEETEKEISNNTDLIVLDVFEDVELTYKGCLLDDIGISLGDIQYKGDNQFIKDNVTYEKTFGQWDFLENGKPVNITAVYDKQLFEDNGYAVLEDTKDFIVSGIEYYADAIFDQKYVNELNDLLEETLKKKLLLFEHRISHKLSEEEVFKDSEDADGFSKFYKATDFNSIEPMEHILYHPSRGGHENCYQIIYRVKFELEDPDNDSTIISDYVYCYASLENIIIKPDGSIEYDDYHLDTDLTDHCSETCGGEYDEVRDRILSSVVSNDDGKSEYDMNNPNIYYTDYVR